MLALGDVALLPWVPLAKLSGPPETTVRRCTARIDHEVPSPDREDLLTVAQSLLKLRYDEKPVLKRLREVLGGREVMIQSPLYQEIVGEAERNARQRDSWRRNAAASLRFGSGSGHGERGGRGDMIQSPLYQEIVEEAKREGATEAMQQHILDLLELRFGPQAKDIEVELKAAAFDRLRDLHRLAAMSRNLASFRKRLLP